MATEAESVDIMLKTPGMQAFQFVRETEDGDEIAEQVRLQPGEVKTLSADEFEELSEHPKFSALVDARQIEVDPNTGETALRNTREEIVHGSLSAKWIRRFSAKSGDVESVGQQQVRQAEQALQ